MTTENQTPVQGQNDVQQAIQVGFEKALIQMNPEWRTAFTVEQINLFRHYYHQGIQDMNLLNNLNYQNAQQNFQAVLRTVVVTGNEARIAELQAEQAAQAAAEVPPADQVPNAKGLFGAKTKPAAKRAAAKAVGKPAKASPKRKAKA